MRSGRGCCIATACGSAIASQEVAENGDAGVGTSSDGRNRLPGLSHEQTCHWASEAHACQNGRMFDKWEDA